MSRDPALEAAYRDAEYHVFVEALTLTLRIGRYDVRADAILAGSGIHLRWSILTPFNPYPQGLAAPANLDRLAQLTRFLDNSGQRWWPARNSAPGGGEPREDGVLWCDPAAGAAAVTGRRFGQAAIVAARLGEAPALVWLAPD